MKPFVIILLLALITASCSPQRRLNHLITHHPELTTPDTLILRDTITIPGLTLDTILRISTIHDTVTLTKEHLQVKVHHQRDTLYIQSITQPDTIIRTHFYPIQEIRYTTPDILDNLITRIPWLVIGLGMTIILVIYLITRFTKK
jgi:hypothetical protein